MLRGASVLSPDPDFRRVTEKQRLGAILNLAPCICLSESEMGIFVNLAGICQGTEEAGRLGKESVSVESGPTGCYEGCRRSITIAPSSQSVLSSRHRWRERCNFHTFSEREIVGQGWFSNPQELPVEPAGEVTGQEREPG